MHGGVYPGIDLRYYGNRRQLEYDFVLNPGADPHTIAINFDGAKGLAIDNAGNLAMDSDAGRVMKPSVYQMLGREKKTVSGGYILRPDHSVGLKLGAYDSTKSLVVDPVLVYSSYLGGSGWDAAISVTLDASGNEYIGGFTISPDFPSASTAILPLRTELVLGSSQNWIPLLPPSYIRVTLAEPLALRVVCGAM